MLNITIPSRELWDEKNERFITTKQCTFTLEHSLISISKWEAKWQKPYLSSAAKSYEESIDYVRCMNIGQDISDEVLALLTKEHFDTIAEYINNPMTASSVKHQGRKGNNGEQITSELIYYWMVALQIPFNPCEKWHLNRLLMLVEICNAKNQPGKKMPKKEMAKRNHSLNAARKARHGTHG